MINSSGGDYAYLGEAYGPLPAFLYLWAAVLIIIPVTNAIIALAFANYILQPLWGPCASSDFAVRLVAAFSIGICGGQLILPLMKRLPHSHLPPFFVPPVFDYLLS